MNRLSRRQLARIAAVTGAIAAPALILPKWHGARPGLVGADAGDLAKLSLASHFGFGMVGGGGAASFAFIGYAARYDGSLVGPITWPSGTRAGDLAISIVFSNTYAVSSGWVSDFANAAMFSNSWSGQSKVLTSTDISSPPSTSVSAYGPWVVAVFRGATAVTFKSVVTGLSGTGFTKNANSVAVVSIGGDRSNNPGTGLVEPTGFTQRSQIRDTYFDVAFADIPSGTYVNSSSMTWTDGNSPYGTGVAIYELTN